MKRSWTTLAIALACAWAGTARGDDWVPCWAEGSKLICHDPGERTLFEAAGEITHAIGSLEGHVLFVAKGKVWLFAHGSAKPVPLATVAKLRPKGREDSDVGDVLGLDLYKDGPALVFEAGQESEGVDVRVPLPKGFRFSMVPEPTPSGAPVSPSGRWQFVRRPLKLVENETESIGITEGASPPRFDLVDIRIPCKNDFYCDEKECGCPCEVPLVTWLVGDNLLVRFAGGCDQGWSKHYVWIPRQGMWPLAVALVSPDGGRLLTDRGFIDPEGKWQTSQPTAVKTGMWLRVERPTGAPAPAGVTAAAPPSPKPATARDITTPAPLPDLTGQWRWIQYWRGENDVLRLEGTGSYIRDPDGGYSIDSHWTRGGEEKSARLKARIDGGILAAWDPIKADLVTVYGRAPGTECLVGVAIWFRDTTPMVAGHQLCAGDAKPIETLIAGWGAAVAKPMLAEFLAWPGVSARVAELGRKWLDANQALAAAVPPVQLVPITGAGDAEAVAIARRLLGMIFGQGAGALDAFLPTPEVWSRLGGSGDVASMAALTRKKMAGYPGMAASNGYRLDQFTRVELSGTGRNLKVSLLGDSGRPAFHIFLARWGSRWYLWDRPDLD